MTRWSSEVNPLAPWPEYPRPQMVRNDWMNLNGLWDYAITAKDAGKPKKWQGKILVPYPVESALSGVKAKMTDSLAIWYQTTFAIPSDWKEKQIMLNFEASDWETTVWIDGEIAGIHRGGYDPFGINITDLFSKRRNHTVTVKVWDPTDKSSQPRGKQVTKPGGIWYTSSTGIWQTVWLEPVSEISIADLEITPDVDRSRLYVTVRDNPAGIDTSLKAEITVMKERTVIAKSIGSINKSISLDIKEAVLWRPENPFLYDLRIRLIKDNDVIDEVSSYAGMRKISVGRAEDGYTRILLNNHFVEQSGTLDQGFWPDGIYTPPTEEAMKYDLVALKEMGFNMLRKHVKVEPRRYYYLTDKLGILVWQDMPSAEGYISGDMPDLQKSVEDSSQFAFELQRLIETRYNNPSVIMWVIFNEGWGQFKTADITLLASRLDTTRLINSASGWTDRGTGDISDVHHYPDPVAPKAEEKRAIVLGEFGGLGLPVNGHTWEKKNWGYRNMRDSLQLLSRFTDFYSTVRGLVKNNGLSATIYTQTTDVETETNGLLTYDRAVNKMGSENVRKALHGK
ncbi:MAG TPA: glycoside hydrolase family 2 TIM barrel-domain containing protein [Bacteroidales bacterium]|nr:glycoside hydrolase family 2 TIM barrel-domain containing protein [Bacteroidales bacterium]